MKKTLYIIILLISLPTTVLGYTYQSTEYALYVDGVEIKTDTSLYQINGEYFASIRALGEGLNAFVSWDASTQTAIFDKDGNKLLVPMNSNQFIFNDNVINVSTSAQIISGRTLLPIKSVVECFGYSYKEYEQKGVISVYSSDIAPEIFIKPEITNCSMRYYKETDDDFIITCDFNDGILSKIIINEYVLNSEEYTFNEKEITIKKEVFQSLNIGINHLTIYFQNDFSLSNSVFVLNQYDSLEYTPQSTEYALYVDGVEIKTDTSLYQINGEYFAPIRALGEGLNAFVSWDASTQTAIFDKDGNKLLVPMNSNQFIFNDNVINVSTSAQIISGRTLLPIKSVVECFGYRYKIDESNCLIKVNENDFAIYSIEGYEKLFLHNATIIKLKYKNNLYDCLNVYVAFYDETGKFQGVFYDKFNISNGNKEIEFIIPEKTFGEESVVKLFSWNDNLSPLSYRITITEKGYVFN